ncbi:hypothetical protein LTR66_015988 [Elasticomyces elasticus]|nr:hypothetical protein LTR66_015988 [Elasticomyces elasticus]
MDHGEQEEDEHNFSTSSSHTHRLPTLNGADALLDALQEHRPISTGLTGIDQILSSDSIQLDSQHETGVQRGTVTELYGVPSCGKTAICMQLTAHALTQDSEAVVSWIDTGSPLPWSRLDEMCASAAGCDNTTITTIAEDTDTQSSLLHRLNHGAVATLPQLSALILHPPDSWPPAHTSLLIIDDISNIIMAGLPQSSRTAHTTGTPGSTQKREDILSKHNALRRASIISSLSLGLQRLAATRNIAIVVTSNTTSARAKTSGKAVLRSVFHSQQWNEGITNRIVLYRNRWSVDSMRFDGMTRLEKRKQMHKETFPLRIAEIERLRGQEVSAQGVKFVITSKGLRELEPPGDVAVTVVAEQGRYCQGLLSDNNNDAMQNMGLEDDLLFESEGLEDDLGEQEDMAEAEEALPGSSPPTLSHSEERFPEQNAEVLEEHDEPLRKEIADSKGGEDDLLPALPRQASNMSETSKHAGFLPSSQLLQQKRPPDDDGSHPLPLTRRSKRIAKDMPRVNGMKSKQQEDDMLLGN